jgi:hypothetical protein
MPAFFGGEAMRILCRWRVLAGLALVALAGCGGGRAPVSGVVTLDGQPLADASVSFEPADASATDPAGGSYAKTDAAGRYTLKMVKGDGRGAVVGKHVVRISRYESGGDSDAGDGREQVPARYNAGTELTFEVKPGGTDAADFHLESGKKPGR